MEGQESKQQPHLALGHKLFLLAHHDVDDIDKVRLHDEVLDAVKADVSVPSPLSLASVASVPSHLSLSLSAPLLSLSLPTTLLSLLLLVLACSRHLFTVAPHSFNTSGTAREESSLAAHPPSLLR